MSQSRKKKAEKGATEQAQNPVPQAGNGGGKRTRIIIAAAVIIIMAAIVGFFYNQQYIAPFRRPVITVDDTTIRMGYFLSRLEVSGADPIDMLNRLSREQIIRLTASQYGIEVSPEDIDETLRATFRGESETISESEFGEWYRQLLNERGLSGAEFRDLIFMGVLSARLQEYLAARMPTVVNHRLLYVITMETWEEALEARARWEAGEDFSELARELSLDEVTRENGGELGWFPMGGVLEPNLEYEVFSLSTGNVSQPIAIMGKGVQEGETVPATLGYYIVLVSEEAVRELDEDTLRVVQSGALEKWYSEERGNHEVKWHGFNNGFDSETYAWVNWQLAKRKPSGADQAP